jgi:FkbM family methyltransferase
VNPYSKYRIKRLLSGLGIRVRPGTWARRSFVAFCGHLVHSGFEPSVVLDVGVADGTYELYDAFPDAHHLLIEPMEEFVPAMEFITQRYDASYVLVAASDADGEAPVDLSGDFAGDLHGASLLQEAGREQDAQRTIRTARLDTIVAERGLSGPFLMKVDVQGFELAVLDGAPEVLKQTEVVVLETSMFRFKPDGPLVHEVFSYMADRGFVPYEFIGGHNRPTDDALAQIDVAFVQRDGRFRRGPAYAREEQLSSWSGSLIARVRRIVTG